MTRRQEALAYEIYFFKEKEKENLVIYFIFKAPCYVCGRTIV